MIDGIDISTIGIHDLRSRVVSNFLWHLLLIAYGSSLVDIHSSSELSNELPFHLNSKVFVGRDSFLGNFAR